MWVGSALSTSASLFWSLLLSEYFLQSPFEFLPPFNLHPPPLPLVSLFTLFSAPSSLSHRSSPLTPPALLGPHQDETLNPESSPKALCSLVLCPRSNRDKDKRNVTAISLLPHPLRLCCRLL